MVAHFKHTRKKRTKMLEKTTFTNLKKRFEHIELPVKLLDYFLRSNKSNINQSVATLFGKTCAKWIQHPESNNR